MLNRRPLLPLALVALTALFTLPALADPRTGADRTGPGERSSGPAVGDFLPEGVSLPAFSTTGWNEPGYVGFDAGLPGDLTVINPDQPTSIFAAAFLGNDFDRHYGLASSLGDLEQDTFLWIDTETGAYTELGVVEGGAGDNWTSLSWDYTRQTLFATSPEALYIIDPDALEATLVGPIEGADLDEDVTLIAMAVRDDGRMFAVEIESNVLLEIDPDSGQAEVVGDLGVDPTFAQDMDFDHRDGTLYWASYFGGGDSRMKTIDTETGETTLIGEIEDGAELNSFTLAIPASLPEAVVEPEAISLQLEADEVLEQPLTISNQADSDPLQWSLTDAEASADGGAATGHRLLTDGSPLPAFSTTGWNEPGYVGFDAGLPGDLTVINPDQPTSIFAAAFLGNDFDRHYGLASSLGDLEQDTFLWIDTETGAYTELGVVEGGAGDNWTSLSWDYTRQTLFATSPEALYIIDPDALEATLVGPIEGADLDEDVTLIAMAVRDDGRMFAVEIESNVLLEIDPDSGQAEVVGDLGVDPTFAQDMDFDHRDGTLYWASYFGGGDSRMKTIDTETGETTLIGEIEDGAELNSFTLAIPWVPGCALPSEIDWLSADILSGNVSPKDSQVVTLSIDTSSLESGLHAATLCLETSDPANALISVPVELEVTDSPEIFRDRFEAN